MDDREHRILIEKLGAAKTSEERDRILRDLANQDRADRGEPQETETTGIVKPATAEPLGKTLGYVPPWMRTSYSR